MYAETLSFDAEAIIIGVYYFLATAAAGLIGLGMGVHIAEIVVREIGKGASDV